MTYHHLLPRDLFTQNFFNSGSEELREERGAWGRGEEGRKSYQLFITPPEFDSCLHLDKWEGLGEGG